MIDRPSEKKILIVSVTPYFLQKDYFWFSQNFSKIASVAKTQVWWKENTIFLEKDQQINLFALLRRLTDFGYERTQTLGGPGQFSQRGGILDVFPINQKHALRLEFFGNKISEIYPLDIKILKKEAAIKKELTERASTLTLSNLKVGEYLVHLDHGIGIFKGFAQTPGGKISESAPTPETNEKYFVLAYAKNDRLYVPLSLEEKLSRYVGFETPIVHRLGGTLWFNTKRKVKENVLRLAKELLTLYAKRAATVGYAFPKDDALQKELENSFEFIETDDQLTALQEVKKDMESEKPMDRLICGDVGFGKTEVALRAAFKAVLAGKQVALLCPTTILAHQHWRTFSRRLKNFPVNLSLLSRLQSKKSQKQITKDIAEGKIDIVIGTHRLIQKDVSFKNLGLVIIDEEQRFGVKQKEFFKGLRETNLFLTEQKPPAEHKDKTINSSALLSSLFNDLKPVEKATQEHGVDILSLSATPIPRTMQLALTKLRDISLIQTPPPGRLPVKTFIEPFSSKIIKTAIINELNRNGQVYYLHNRVETIELAARQIKKLFENDSSIYPKKRKKEIQIGIAHGRMKEKQLLKVMTDFNERRIDVLVATTIIENGLDFPNVNTLIVANATKLGLPQSYQLRGRIGRSNIQAFAYFLYNAKNLTAKAAQRLEALKEAEALGSGYQIALRDLEIRGAGNVLGREQSGPINSVGLNLYMQLLAEAVEELKTE